MAIRDTPGILDALLTRVAAGIGLLDEEQVQAAMLDLARDAFVAIDQTGAIIGWNAAAERIFGWTREEALGRQMAELIIPEERREAHRRGIARHLETGEAPIFGTRIAMPALRRDGRVVPVELTASGKKIRKRWVYVASMRRL